MRKPLSASPRQDTDFFGNPLYRQEPLPKESVIAVSTSIPHVGDRVTHITHGTGTVLSVGPMAHMGPKNRSIEVMFGDGHKWFVAQVDLLEA